MKNRFLVRRIFLLLVAAILLWTVLTAVFYSFVAHPVFTRIKARELLPRAEIIAKNVSGTSDFKEIESFASTIIDQSDELFGNWIYIVNSDGNIVCHTHLPNTREDVNERLASLVIQEHWELAQNPKRHHLAEIKIPPQGDRFLILSVPVINSDDGHIVGTVVIVQPANEMDAGIQSLNFALITSSLIVLVIMVIPIIIAALRILSPLESIRRVSVAMAEGDFSQRADETQEGEIGDLAKTINWMAEELYASFQQLSNQRNNLKQIIDSIEDGIAACNRDGKITVYNDRIYSLFGLDPRFAKNTTPDAFLARTRIGSFFSEAMDKKEAVSCVMTKDHRQIQVVVTPLISEQNTITGAVGLFRDVTKEQQLEQIRRDYVANVSHELRTPLTAMRGLLEPLTEGMVKDPNDQQRYHSILLRETMRLSRLINDMLELSNIQAGTNVIELGPVNVTDIAHGLFDAYDATVMEHGLTLNIHGAEHRLPPAWGNTDRIEQILVILIDNAMKFTHEGGTITIKTSANDQRVHLGVRDTGIGIAANDLDHVFDRFYKADRAHNEPGTGLGLSIAHLIAEQMGAELTVKSELGKGSCFTLSMPLADNVMRSLDQMKDVYDSRDEN
jgi:two-component system sensor histidine kinase ResE